MSEKKGYILPYGTAAQISRLIKASGPEAAMAFLEAIESYTMDGTEPEGLDPVGEILFESMRKEMDIDREKYDRMVQQRKDAIAERWRKEKDTTVYDRTKPNTDSRQKTEDSRQKMENIDSTISAEPVIVLPLNHGEHTVTEDDVREYMQLYPAVDVMQELRNMRGWLISNPGRRKTSKGIRTFITTWLSKRQDKPTARSGTRLTMQELSSLPIIDPFAELRGAT